MSVESAPPKKKLPLVTLAIVAVVLLIAGVFVLRAVGMERLVGWLDQLVGVIRGMGPWVFFAAMTVLPALGVPMLAFTIPAGEAFAPTMGMGGVIAVALVVIALNLALSYWVARYALRPLLTRLLTRYGYSVPRITRENALSVLLVVRLTPGPPYAFQCFLLGLAEAPFKLYMIVSWLAILPYALAAIILGQGLRNGNFKTIIAAVGVIVVATIGLQWLRKKYFPREG
ncbi:TVP38/TMEM64 family protein [Horticoccus sp. 23ND18S-11]|uniref:TVP38/TMEM64 family protein n=1 Tax=Horticoccus sp. 23ND18S-11 TaxID=3391832 RepID=UPI0039C8C1C5